MVYGNAWKMATKVVDIIVIENVKATSLEKESTGIMVFWKGLVVAASIGTLEWFQ